MNRIGRYQITARLGEGGMGVVYRAYDPAPMDREVAVKTLHEFTDPFALELFYKECGALKSISHPNIVEIFDIGEFEDAGHRQPFFVMPLLSGQTLDDLIKRASHRLTVDRVVESTRDPLFLLNDACYHETRRLDGSKRAKDLERLEQWRGLARRLARMSADERREKLREIAHDYAADIAGNFDPRVYKVSMRIVPALVTSLLQPRALVGMAREPSSLVWDSCATYSTPFRSPESSSTRSRTTSPQPPCAFDDPLKAWVRFFASSLKALLSATRLRTCS